MGPDPGLRRDDMVDYVVRPKSAILVTMLA
jgi:hypothetical protein